MYFNQQIFENTAVTNVLTEPTPNNEKKIIGLQTNHGSIKTSTIVNACGIWARELTQKVGLDIPVTAIKHAYVVTGSIPGSKGVPCIRDHDGCLYFRPQGDSIVFGGYESNPEIIKEVKHKQIWALFGIPDTFRFLKESSVYLNWIKVASISTGNVHVNYALHLKKLE